MIKTIKLSGKDYVMKSSAYTPFAYQNFTQRGMLSDIKKLAKIEKNMSKLDSQEERSMFALDNLQTINELGLSLAYVMIREQDEKQITSFEEWLKSLDNLYDNMDWISEVVECAMSTFQGRV